MTPTVVEPPTEPDTRATEPDTLADVLRALGDIPLDRILWTPRPGTATEADVVRYAEREPRRLVELIDGVLVEKPMGAESDEISLGLGASLRSYVRANALGRVFGSSTGYRCFPHKPLQVRKPDASFVSTARLPDGQAPKGDILVPPDLAVEVISPNDLAESLEERLSDYRKAGVRLVWVVSPGSRTVQVRRPDGSAAILNESATLSGEDVIPGFACNVADLFT